MLRAIRENEDRARAIGFRVRRFKIAAFAISGALSGLAGGLYAELYRFVPLQAIDLETSTNVVVAALLGGVGSPYGALLGAAIFVVLSDSLSHVWSHWPLIFGLVFCAVVLFFRSGLWGLVEPLEPPCCARVSSSSASARTARSTASTWRSARGTLHAIIGPNGAGKTTLFNLLSGELRPSGGTIELAGRDVTRLDATDRSHLGMGRSFQRTNVFPKLTAFENVRLAAQSRTAQSFALWRSAAALHDVNARAERVLARDGPARRTASSRRTSSPAATSACSSSRSRSPPIRRCCCSTNRRKASRPKTRAV